jgi:3-phenylpropionate/cinnamic acid dioxygenase small subunit
VSAVLGTADATVGTTPRATAPRAAMGTTPNAGTGLRSGVREAVEDLYDDYVEALNGGDIERWPELFTADGTYLLIAKENHDRGLPVALMRCESRGMLADRVQSITRLSTYAPRVLRHVVGHLRIRPFGDSEDDGGGVGVDGEDGNEGEREGEGPALAVTASYVVLQTLLDEETRVLSCGRYLDEIVDDDGRLRFRRKVTIYDNPLVPNSIVYPL